MGLMNRLIRVLLEQIFCYWNKIFIAKHFFNYFSNKKECSDTLHILTNDHVLHTMDEISFHKDTSYYMIYILADRKQRLYKMVPFQNHAFILS